MKEQTKITISQSLMIFAMVLVFIFLFLTAPAEAAKGIYTPPATNKTNLVHELSLGGSIDLVGSGVR
tara:strand:+ start:207 stop:407 length:201 start_codon:yes stop_codon:yes gene_type:complete